MEAKDERIKMHTNRILDMLAGLADDTEVPKFDRVKILMDMGTTIIGILQKLAKSDYLVSTMLESTDQDEDNPVMLEEPISPGRYLVH